MKALASFVMTPALAVVACTRKTEPRILELVLDGEKCDYTGPDTLYSGPIDIEFSNLTGGRTWVHLAELPPDRAVEDLKDWFDTVPGGGLSSSVSLVWYGGVFEVDSQTVIAGEVKVSPGVYGMSCGSVNPDFGHFAGTVEVL
jgi:hypothetical protein